MTHHDNIIGAVLMNHIKIAIGYVSWIVAAVVVLKAAGPHFMEHMQITTEFMH